MATMAARF